MSKSNGLIKIAGCDNPERIGDVIFVHGLMGHPRGTWHPKEKHDDDNFWGAWLGEDLPNVGIWSLGYEVEPFTWKGTTMPLVDRATNTLAVLDTYEIGTRPLIFITHSLGGLLVKQMLRHAQDFGTLRWKVIIEQTKGIVFLSTPHSGSDMASWIKHIGGILRTTVSVDELEAHHSRLRELNLLYRNHERLSQIPIEVYCEKQKTYGILVVNETSADPGIPGVIPVPMDCNHISITKPDSKESLIYIRVKKFIQQYLNNYDLDPIQLKHKYSGYFERLITEKSEDFIGRVYVFNAISQFINSRESGYFLLTGDPGMGKSSILAQWVIDNQCIAYFNVKKETDKASEFVENIIEQLNLRYDIKAYFNDNRNEYRGLLSAALEKASQKSQEKIVIVIDALDEVDPYSCQGANVLFLSTYLPKNIFIIMSQRRDTPAQLSGEHLADESLSLLDSRYEGDTNQDIRNYIKSKVNKKERLRKQIEIIATSIDEFIDAITEKSEKNFLYLRHILPDIEDGAYQNITKLDSFPKGLQEYYEKHWERMGMNDKSTPNRIVKLYVIYHLSESYIAISRALLSEYVEQPEIIVQDVIDEWIQFLHKLIIQKETCYKIYHQSFQDFLHRDETVKAIGSDLRKIKKRKADVLWEGMFSEQ
jgi:hypothetical protein